LFLKEQFPAVGATVPTFVKPGPGVDPTGNRRSGKTIRSSLTANMITHQFGPNGSDLLALYTVICEKSSVSVVTMFELSKLLQSTGGMNSGGT